MFGIIQFPNLESNMPITLITWIQNSYFSSELILYFRTHTLLCAGSGSLCSDFIQRHRRLNKQLSWPSPISAILLCPLVVLLPNTFVLFWCQTFGFERTWWRLFQKRVMRTKFDIYVFIKPMILRNRLI
jgi:4-amino-4-deoxy-L-arabinose transferase-like glycosyltransferase